jgi:hypothetical protein
MNFINAQHQPRIGSRVVCGLVAVMKKTVAGG